jgi:4-hydroxy-tetrahydrodipicolinate reductase
VSAVLLVAVVGSRGKLGSFACELLGRTGGFEVVARFDHDEDWAASIAASGAKVAFEATRAGLGFEHGMLLLERGLRPVIATSGVSAEETSKLDARARELGLGGIVVPNFSLGSLLMQRFAEEAARHFAGAEIVELHHERKPDAPSGTAAETARRIANARRAAELAPFIPPAMDPRARGDAPHGVPIHSLRLPGLYAHQEVLFGAPGETLTLRHDMSGPSAFGPGILASLRYAATAVGVARGLDAALR